MNDQTTPDEVEVIEMTPQSAIQTAIYDLLHERRAWKDRDDPNGVRPWIDARIANLTQAQRELNEYRKVKAALAVLKELA